MKKTPKRDDADMLDEYDFSKGVRGKYAAQLPQDIVMVVLEPDVAKTFPSGKSVNGALRLLIRVSKKVAEK